MRQHRLRRQRRRGLKGKPFIVSGQRPAAERCPLVGPRRGARYVLINRHLGKSNTFVPNKPQKKALPQYKPFIFLTYGNFASMMAYYERSLS
jgi:hypothetical protein